MPKISKYLVVGGLVYLLELGIVLAAETVGTSPTWAVAISFIVGTSVSFLLQKFVTFEDKRMARKVVASQVIATGVLIAWNFGFTILLTYLLQDHMPAVMIRTLALAITTVWNFYLYKTRIFNASIAGIVD